MAIEMLSYSQLGERLSCSPEAARALVKRLHLPRQKANDGRVLVSVDLSEVNHKPMPARSPADHHPITTSLKARVAALQAELAKVEASAACHRADFERARAPRPAHGGTIAGDARHPDGQGSVSPARWRVGGPAVAAVVASAGGLTGKQRAPAGLCQVRPGLPTDRTRCRRLWRGGHSPLCSIPWAR